MNIANIKSKYKIRDHSLKSASSAFNLNTKTSQKTKYGLTRPIKNLFPDHEPLRRKKLKKYHMNYMFKRTYDFEIRKKKGKATTIIEGYEGSDEDFKILTKNQN
jgi:hypothetical protein